MPRAMANMTKTQKQVAAVIAGLAVGWGLVHLLVVNWDKLKALLS
jgi:hypothetical protein